MKHRHVSLWPALVASALTWPATLHAQAPTKPICMDGTSASGSDLTTCTEHGGVDYIATYTAENARASAARDTTSTVVCLDGSRAAAGPTACLHHGAIDSAGTRAALKARGRGQSTSDTSSTFESTSLDSAGAPPRPIAPANHGSAISGRDST